MSNMDPEKRKKKKKKRGWNYVVEKGKQLPLPVNLYFNESSSMIDNWQSK